MIHLEFPSHHAGNIEIEYYPQKISVMINYDGHLRLRNKKGPSLPSRLKIHPHRAFRRTPP